MTVSPYGGGGGNGGGNVQRSSGSALVDVIDTILDKGLVIDAFVRVSLVGIELITIDARIVVASVDTYLRFAEATNRLDLYEKGGKDLPGLMKDMTEGGMHSGAKGKTKGMLEGAKETVEEIFEDRREDRDGDREERRETRRRPPRRERDR
jgi:gas vesicle structural protein